ncbi:MAG: hypothetical protein NUV84_02875 [Candidatus Uhrbacteria bacterium]|nr:hypothetical protein [Candidatus Uhrbacteria bacterium]
MASKIKTEPISVRDFLRNFATLVANTSFKQYVIMKHGKPVGIFTPWEAQKTEMKQGYPGSFWEEAKKHRFSGPADLSQRIDEIVYGIGRDTVPD